MVEGSRSQMQPFQRQAFVVERLLEVWCELQRASGGFQRLCPVRGRVTALRSHQVGSGQIIGDGRRRGALRGQQLERPYGVVRVSGQQLRGGQGGPVLRCGIGGCAGAGSLSGGQHDPACLVGHVTCRALGGNERPVREAAGQAGFDEAPVTDRTHERPLRAVGGGEEHALAPRYQSAGHRHGHGGG